jgi:hypothetical protein
MSGSTSLVFVSALRGPHDGCSLNHWSLFAANGSLIARAQREGAFCDYTQKVLYRAIYTFRLKQSPMLTFKPILP